MRCDIKTMCCIVFISHSLHWHYIKIALQEYVIIPYEMRISFIKLDQVKLSSQPAPGFPLSFKFQGIAEN